MTSTLRVSLSSTISRATKPVLVVLLGPTGVGKTTLSINLAAALDTEIISADSRQIYRELPIGTAAPSQKERAAVPHHLVGVRSVEEYYSASQFAEEATAIAEGLHRQKDYVLVVGGSMMYIDALVRGIDEMPDVDPIVREQVWARYTQEGLEPILSELRILDPVYYHKVDRKNYKRVLHGYEMCLSTGRPFSAYHTDDVRERPWEVILVGLNREREELYARINERVLAMVEAGLEAEARAVYPQRKQNALNTVGYKEMFAYFDGQISREEAIRQIQRNSRIYARKQMSWWRRDSSIRWFHPDEETAILAYIQTYTRHP